MKKQSGTHRSMGKKGSIGSGLESGVSHTEKFRAGQGVQVNAKTERPRKESHGSIATK